MHSQSVASAPYSQKLKMKLQDLHPKNKRGNFKVSTPYFHTNNEIPQNPLHETPKYSKKNYTLNPPTFPPK